MNRRTVAVCMAMLLAVLLLAAMPCAAAEARQVVRVALPLQDGFAQRDAKGTLSGYSYEYLERISQINGWELSYTVFDDDDTNVNLINAMNAVQNGEADLVDLQSPVPV